MSTSKKPKTDDFETVKQYLLDCPHVSTDHPAIKAAIDAIEVEERKQERDAKLQRKFHQDSAVADASPAGATSAASSATLEDSVVVVDSASTPPPTAADDAADEMMEWQDVTSREKEDGPEDDGTSYVGKVLSRLAIDTISEKNVKVMSPLAAIAVVFHAAMRSELLQFSCTGIPEDDSAPKGGFAAPVRDLAPSQFLPGGWDSKPTEVSLRYRKQGTGSLVLRVAQQSGDTNPPVTVHLQAASSKEPSSQCLTFSLADHVNLDSWNAAKKASPNVSPALHYKSLANLMTFFCQTFDLGPVDEGNGELAAYVDNTVPAAAVPTTGTPSIQKSDFVAPQPHPAKPTTESRSNPNWKSEVPTTLGEAFPLAHPHSSEGDFADDLAPGGLRDPRFVPEVGGGRMGGNLMGPNHPLFHGGGGLPMGGPGSMQPRFDPVYPEGIDPLGNPVPGRPTNRPSRTGEPNPDHLPPPNSFGTDNMFS